MAELSRTKLRQFDLEKDLEKELLESEQKKLFGLLSDIHRIYTVDQFIKDCPSFPGSNRDLIKDEIISSVGATLAIEGIVLREEEIRESFDKADVSARLKDKEQEAENTRKAYKYIVDTVEACEGEFVYSEEHLKTIEESK